MVDSQSHFPSPDEQNFIRALRMILNGTMRRDGQLAEMAGWRAEFLTPGRRLMHAMYEGGPVEFWRTYDLLFPQNDRQEGWKALVAAPHDPFSGNLAAKEHGQEPDGPSGSSSTQHVGPPLAGDSLPTPWARSASRASGVGSRNTEGGREGLPSPMPTQNVGPPLAGGREGRMASSEDTKPGKLNQDGNVSVNHTPRVTPAAAEAGVLISEVAYTPVDWLWKGRLALGKITLLDGDPGMGKSNLTLDLAARLSLGDVMPDGQPIVGGASGVVLITPEDTIGDTVRPRLERVGANLKRIVSLSTITVQSHPSGMPSYERPFSLAEDLERLEEAIQRVQARLLVIDPVMAVLRGRDVFKDNDVRLLFAPLQALIERLGVACLLVRHLTKSGGENALYRGSGSLAFMALARIGLMVIPDPEDEQRRVLAFVKSNLARPGSNLLFSITSDEERGDDRPYVRWHGESRYSVKELLSGSAPTGNLGNARQEILRLLKESYPEPRTTRQIAEELPETTREGLGMALTRMVETAQIERVARGTYRALTA